MKKSTNLDSGLEGTPLISALRLGLLRQPRLIINLPKINLLCWTPGLMYEPIQTKYTTNLCYCFYISPMTVHWKTILVRKYSCTFHIQENTGSILETLCTCLRSIFAAVMCPYGWNGKVVMLEGRSWRPISKLFLLRTNIYRPGP